MTWTLLILAAVSYVAGGVAMKHADGLRHLLPSLLVFAAFGLGAALQTLAMRYESLGVGYVVVLGLEAALAVLAGVLLLHETLPLRQLCGIALVIAGIILLKAG
ncbi:MAG: DMT family transporter [Candidatus Xenobia bacterium]